MITVVYLENGLTPQKRIIKEVSNTTIRENAPNWGTPFLAVVDGSPVLRKDWDSELQDGKTLAFVDADMVPQDGGGGGSDPFRIVLMIAVMYVAIQTGGAVGTFLTPVGTSAATATAIGTTVVSMVGMALVNAVLPVPQVPTPQAMAAMAAPSPTYSLNAQGNSARIGSAIPEHFGRHKVYPDLVAAPYTEFENNEQYLYQLLCVGTGEYEFDTGVIEDNVKIEDTAISHFPDADVEVVPPYTHVTKFPSYVVNSTEVSGQELNAKWVGEIDNTAHVTITDIATPFVYGGKVYVYPINGSADNIAQARVFCIGTVTSNSTITVVQLLDELPNGTADTGTAGFTGYVGTVFLSIVVGGFVINDVNTLVSTIKSDFVCPRGLYYTDDSGNLTEVTIDVRAEYREVNKDTGLPISGKNWAPLIGTAIKDVSIWIKFNGAIGVTAYKISDSINDSSYWSATTVYSVPNTTIINGLTTTYRGVSLAKVYSMVLHVDPEGGYYPTYEPLTNHYEYIEYQTSHPSTSIDRFSASTNTPQRYTRVYNMPNEGRFEVRAYRLTQEDTSARAANSVMWAGLRGYQPEYQTATITSCIGLADADMPQDTYTDIFTKIDSGYLLKLSYVGQQLNIATKLPHGLSTGKAPTWYRPIDALRGWSTIHDSLISASAFGYITNIVSSTEFSIKLWVQVSSSSVESNITSGLNRSNLLTNVGRVTVGQSIKLGRTYGNTTLLAVKMRASNSLSLQASRKINVIATRKLPELFDNGSITFTTRATRNPTDALYYIARKLGLSQAQIDWKKLYQIGQTCISKGTLIAYNNVADSFDGRFDNFLNGWEALTKVASAIRTKPYMQGGILRFMRDELVNIPTAMYSPRNIVKGSFSINYLMPTENTADIIDLTYLDSKTWKPQTIQCFETAGLPVPIKPSTTPAKVDLFGVVTREQAFREGQYLVATNLRRRKIITFQTEMEGFIPSYGDLINVQHDMPGWGSSGEIIGWDPVNKLATLSEPHGLIAGAYVISVRNLDGSVQGPYGVIADYAGGSAVTLLDYPLVTPTNMVANVQIYTGTQKERSHYSIGTIETYTQPAKVISVKPNSMTTVTIECVNEDNTVHTIDVGVVTPAITHTYLKDYTDKPLVTYIAAESIIFKPNLVRLSWKKAPYADHYEIRYSTIALNIFGHHKANNWSDPIISYATSIEMPRAKCYLVTAIGVNPGSNNVVYAPEPLPPTAVSNVTATYTDNGYILSWPAVADDNLVTYRLVNTSTSSSVEVSGTSFNIGTIPAGTSITYEVYTVDTAAVISITAASVTINSPTILPPTSLAAESGTANLIKNADGTITPRIKVTIGIPTQANIKELVITYYEPNNTKPFYLVYPTDTTTVYITDVVEGGLYNISAKYINNTGDSGEWYPVDMLYHTVVGKTEKPSNVAGLTAVSNEAGFMVYWDKPTDPDYKNTTVRVTNTTDGNLLVPQITTTSTIVQEPKLPNGTYRIWAFHTDTSGNDSAVTQMFSYIHVATVLTGSVIPTGSGAAVNISDIAANSLVPTVNFVGAHANPPDPGTLGNSWKQNAMYKNTTDGKSYILTGSPLAWAEYIADGTAYTVVIESSNGNIFRIAGSPQTTLTARVFKNGAEVFPDLSWYKWRRASYILDTVADADWNTAHSSGKTVTITVNSVTIKATFFCDITSP